MRFITSILAMLAVLATGVYAVTESPLEIAEASYPSCAVSLYIFILLPVLGVEGTDSMMLLVDLHGGICTNFRLWT
jgi:hypothetical protein